MTGTEIPAASRRCPISIPDPSPRLMSRRTQTALHPHANAVTVPACGLFLWKRKFSHDWPFNNRPLNNGGFRRVGLSILFADLSVFLDGPYANTNIATTNPITVARTAADLCEFIFHAFGRLFPSLPHTNALAVFGSDQAKKAAVKLGDFAAYLPTEGGVFHRKVTHGRPHAVGPSVSYDRRTTRPSNHRKFESINTSKSFRSRICGRLAGCGGRWFLPRTHH